MEADHVEAPVEVDVQGQLVRPWTTWFVDCVTDAVCGTAVTPGTASQGSAELPHDQWQRTQLTVCHQVEAPQVRRDLMPQMDWHRTVGGQCQR
jgi:hypothetical protein